MTDLKETLRLHKLWLEGDPKGKRANDVPYGDERL